MENTVKKITKVMKFDAIAAMLKGEKPEIEFSADEALDFIANERAMVVAKNARKSDKPSKAAQENEGLYPLVMLALEHFSNGVQCKVLMKDMQNEAVGSTQKLARLLGDLEKEGKVTKRTEKGTTLYSKVSE